MRPAKVDSAEASAGIVEPRALRLPNPSMDPQGGSWPGAGGALGAVAGPQFASDLRSCAPVLPSARAGTSEYVGISRLSGRTTSLNLSARSDRSISCSSSCEGFPSSAFATTSKRAVLIQSGPPTT